jgi:VWFA-related protein
MDDPDLRLQATLQGLTSLPAHVSSLPGRKSIIWISHGVPIDSTWYADAYTANISQLCARMVFDAISVYAVHESVEEGIHLDTGNFLEQFTGLTGGVTFPSDYTADAISQALKDARSNYSIAYRPERFRWDGQFHKIRLRSSRSGVRLRTVAGYYAAAQRQSSRSRWPSAQAQTPIVWPA